MAYETKNYNRENMKTLADVKRKMTLGSKWRCVRVSNQGIDTGVREIGKVQTLSLIHISEPTRPY